MQGCQNSKLGFRGCATQTCARPRPMPTIHLIILPCNSRALSLPKHFQLPCQPSPISKRLSQTQPHTMVSTRAQDRGQQQATNLSHQPQQQQQRRQAAAGSKQAHFADSSRRSDSSRNIPTAAEQEQMLQADRAKIAEYRKQWQGSKGVSHAAWRWVCVVVEQFPPNWVPANALLTNHMCHRSVCALPSATAATAVLYTAAAAAGMCWMCCGGWSTCAASTCWIMKKRWWLSALSLRCWC